MAQLLVAGDSKGVSLGDNLFKIRLRITSKGKGQSGGAHVIVYRFSPDENIALLSIYDKSEREALDKSYLKELVKSAIEMFKDNPHSGT